MRERRAAHRYKLALPIVVRRIPTVSEADLFYGKTCDVSTGGVSFTTCDRLVPGDELDFSFAFPGGFTQGADVFVTGRAKVLRVEREPETVSEPVGVSAVIERFHIVRPEGAGR